MYISQSQINTLDDAPPSAAHLANAGPCTDAHGREAPADRPDKRLFFLVVVQAHDDAVTDLAALACTHAHTRHGQVRATTVHNKNDTS